MKTIQVMIQNTSGLHARPATQLVSEASKYASELVLRTPQNREANLKSIMSVLSLGVTGQTLLELTAEGHDEDQAIEALQQLIEERLAE